MVYTEYTETRLLNEWLAKEHPTALTWKRVRVGPLPKVAMAAAYIITNRWIDAIIQEGGVIYLIEAKLKATPTAIGQLMLYSKLFPDTPEFQQVKQLPRKLVMLVGVNDPAVKALCKDEEIEYIVFSPAWIEKWLNEVFVRR